MTALYGRLRMREWSEEAALSTGISFHDTVNVRVSAQEDVWFTLRFTALAMEGTFCRPGYVEEGYIDLIVVSKPGIGDIPALEAMEQLLPAVFDQVDPTQRFALTSYEPIIEESEGSADSTYRISLQFNYRLSL